ncbi:MAG TPA: hypothetical protein VMD91_04150 [Candidatus Sulfotelmatobacter sp.]|nr:hypothetical protein [Candidatus Sulfotelmatobacter sp.]
MRATRSLWRTLGAFAATFLAGTALASAQVQVNKQFNPTSVALGATSVVTVTLQNSSTTSAATITAFSDDIATMNGFGTLLTSPAPTTTCAGGTPTISGTAVVMNDGSIPIAPNSSTPGTCTITFSVQGSEIGNGFNTIPAASVTTSNGSPTSDVTQTLSVQSANVTVAASAALTVLSGNTTTVTYTITNPAAIALSNTSLAISSNATTAYTISGYDAASTCGGTAALPAPNGTTGTTTLSGLTIPASSHCTVVLDVTTSAVETVNFTLAADAISDAQAATNATGVSAQAKFVNGDPNVTKSFNPTSAQPGGTSVVTIKIANVLSNQSLTSAAESDPLPGGMTVASTPTPTSSGCGTPTLGGQGTGTFTMSAGTIAASATCTVTFTVDIPAAETAGSYTNTIPLANFTSSTSLGGTVSGAAANATATLTVTAAGGNVTAAKAASPTSAGINTPVKITLTYTSQGNGVFSGGSVTDTFPTTPVVMEGYDPSATYNPTFSAGCTGATTPAVGGGWATGATSITVTGMSIPGNGTCVVTFYVYFPNVTGPSRVDANTAGAATFTGADGTVTTGTPSANVTELPTFTVSNYVASASGLTNQPLAVSATVNVPAGYSDTDASVTIPLTTGKVQLASTSNITFTGCPSGTAVSSFGTNDESFTVTLGTTISQNCTINYTVIDEGSLTGTFTPGNPTYTGTVTGGTAVASTGQNNVTFTAPSPIIVTKSFSPNQIQAGGTSTAAIGLVVPQAGSLATTEAEGVAFTDNLPTNMNFSATPNVTFTNCQQTGQPAPSYVITGSSIAFSNISLITVGTTETTCTVNFNVTSNVVGAPLNQIPAGAVTSTAGAGATNTTVAKASLTVSAGLGIAKTFTSSTLQLGGTDYVRFLITNTATTSNLSGGSLVDNMPASLVLASTTEGPSQAGDPALCGGTISGAVGSSSFTLNGLAVAGEVGSVAGQCVAYVQVTTSASAVPGTVSNTIASGGVNIGGYSNQNSGSGSVTLTPPPSPTLTKAFSPTAIAPGATSTLTITIANTASGAVALSGMALTDTLPAGVTIAAAPNAATTCGAGSVTAVGGGGTVALAAGSVAAAGTCTITVSVTSSTSGSYTNTIPVGALTATQGATNASAASATLAVAPPVTLSKAFSPTSIAAGATSTLTVTVANTAAGAVALSAMALTDALPSGVTIAATPNAATTCGTGTATALAGGSTLTLSSAALAAASSCTITVDVTGTVASTYTNTIPAGSVTDTQSVTNGSSATANLTITPASLTIGKAFAPASIVSGGTSTLTITLPNTASGAVALSGMTLTDTLPAGVTIAATPNAATSCGAGTVTAVAGGGSVALSGGSVAAGATCTVTVSVTGTTASTYTNTIPAASLADTQSVSNGNAASANLTVTPAALSIAKAFAPASIASGGTSTLTITIPNTAAGAVALSGMALTDTLPTGVTIASAPNAATTCGAGTVTAVAGSGSVALSGGAVAANASCTISVSVTGTVANTYTNTIAAASLTDTQSVSNGNAATANLTITPAALSIAKAFAPASIASGGISTLTITIPNTASGAVALSGMTLTDALPTGVTVAATPNAATTCGAGTVTAVAGSGSVALSGGSVAASASCTISVSVTGTVANTYTNTISAASLTDTQNVSNGNAASANLTVTPAALAIAKAFSPATITAAGTSTLTITIPNTASGAVALTGMALSDALPAGVTIAATPNAATTCGAGTVTAVAGSGSVALSGGTLAANASCTITVNVTGTLANTYTNTIPAGALTDTQNVSNGSPASANLTIALAPTTLAKAFSPTTMASGGTSTLTITIPNTAAGAVALSALALTDTLPTGVTVAATPNAATTCGSGTVSALAGSGVVTLSAGSVAANASCTITVNVTATLANTYTNTIPAAALTDAQGVGNTTPATATLTVTPAALTVAKAFAPASIASGATSTLTITIPNTAAGAIALNGLALTDALPAGVTIAASPNAATTCPSGTVVATAGGSSVALSGAALAANAGCTVTVKVTGTVANTYTNTIPTGALTDAQSVSNGAPATANLTITPASLTIAKAFAPASITAGATSTLTITIPNTASGAVALSGVTLTDALPNGVTIAATPNAATTCGTGTVTATAGGTSVALNGGTLAAGASCTITVTVTGTVAGTYTNTIPTGALADTQSVSNGAPATASLTVTPAALAIAKAFAPASITAGGTSTLTITIPNTATGAIALSGVTLTDTLPGGVTIAATPNAATTCPSGTVTAPSGGGSVALSGGSLAAGATCTVTVNVTGTVANTYTNTIPAGALGDTQGVANGNLASATLTIVPAGLTVAKAFAPSTIPTGSTSTLTITIPNTAPGAINLSALGLTDPLPTGVTIAPTPNAATTCPSGTVTATAGGGSVALSGASLAANATCTITVGVTGLVVNTYTNTIPSGALGDAQSVTNPAPATATLKILPNNVAVSKAFAPAVIPVGGSATLTITIPNTGTGAIALSALALTDPLPAGVVVAATPHASTTCPSGTVTAAAGASSVVLAGATLAANATCAITVSVSSATAGTYTNTIPTGGLTTAQGVSNANPATAQLQVLAASLSVVKTSNPAGANVGPGQVITYTIAVTNNGSVPETNATLTDTLANATLVTGSVKVNNAVAADGVVTSHLPLGTIAPGATTTVVYNATVSSSASAGTQVTNAVTVGGDVPCTGAACTAASPANIVELPSISVVKTIDTLQHEVVLRGQTVTFTMVVTNSGSAPASNVVLTDPVPGGVTPIAGTVTLNGASIRSASVVGQIVSAPIGTIAVGASATVTFQAKVESNATGTPTNVVEVGSAGLASTIHSNPVVAQIVPSTLQVTKTASASVVRVGDRVDYVIGVSPSQGAGYGETTVVDTLPDYELYAPGTARVNGKSLEPTVRGRTLTWKLPSLTATVTIAYATVIQNGAPQNQTLTNEVEVSAAAPGGAPPGRGHASAQVQTIGSTLGSCYPITGRVYLDRTGSGRYEDGDPGLAVVRIFLDDGESVVTDAHGRYDFPCVRPGMHAMRLDETTLPDGVLPYPDHSIDSEKSTRRLVHRTYDDTIIEDVDFAVTGTLPSPAPTARPQPPR